MLMEDFKNKLHIFADNPDNIIFKSGKMLLEVNDELIEAELQLKDRNVVVNEHGKVLSAEAWICHRLAKLPTLADRILTFIPDEKKFVSVNGTLLSSLENNASEQVDVVKGVDQYLNNYLGNAIPGLTSVTYLTSDAGEGKTTLINKMARQQAQNYKDRKSDWLLLPVPLGGKPFIRFDDVIAGSLVNRLRFPFLYFDSIIELAKLGYLVLALDGFEEMFVVTSSGEAISALGNLLQKLESSGTVLIAARKAYFEFKSMKAQSRLFDTISSCDVSFSKLALDRWGKEQFVEYATKMEIAEPEQIYESVLGRVKEASHPLLTRAVLVNRLLKMLSTVEDNEEIVSKIGLGEKDYFRDFIDVILTREVTEKWIDRKGEVATPLLSKDEHYLLLSAIAEEMWLTSSASLPSSVFDMIAEIICESLRKNAETTRQVVERLKQHALITNSPTMRLEFQFDHEEFRWYFLGDKIVGLVADNKKEELRAIFRVTSLPDFVLEVVAKGLKSLSLISSDVVSTLTDTAQTEGPLSFVKENIGTLLLEYLSGENNTLTVINGLMFKGDSLRSKVLHDIIFKSCFFQATGLAGADLRDCVFSDCEIESFEIASTMALQNVLFEETLPSSVVTDADEPIYDPEEVAKVLRNSGFIVGNTIAATEPTTHVEEEPLHLVRRALRIFLRQTQVNEEVIRIRLGTEGTHFITDVIPQLIKHGIIEEVPYRGGGKQRRFKVRVKMEDFEKAYSKARGNFEHFLSYFG